MNTSKMKHTKLFFLLITTLTTVSCHQSTNESSSESSASDSVELKKQEVWESAHRLDSMGNHREALLLRERTLSEYCPNSAECLQYNYPNIVPTQRSAYSTKDSDVTLRTNRTPPTSILIRRRECAIWHYVTALILTW